MSSQNLKEYKEKLGQLTEEEQKQRDLYLKGLADGTLQGPEVGLPNIDKPWLALFSDDDITEDLPEQLVSDFLFEKNKDNLENVLLEYFNTVITGREYEEKVAVAMKRLANDYGIKEGDVVSLCLPTIPETYYLFQAINQLGAIANFIDPRINEERIKDCIGEKSKIVFAIDTFGEKIESATRHLDIDVISVSPSQSLNIVMKTMYKLKAKPKKIDRFKKWDSFIKGKNKNSNNEVQKAKYKKNMPAAIVYTSGTTGVPKGAMLTNENIISIAIQQAKHVPDMEKGDKYLVIMPPFIAYGLVCGICCPMSTCQRMILIPKFEPKDFPNLIAKHKPNHMLGVPSFFESLTKSELIQKMDLSFIKYCIVGGDKMTVETERKINDFFKQHNVKNKIVKGYGMTELGSAAITTHDDESNKLGSAGIPYVKNNVKIIDPSTHEDLGYEEKGEIYISSPSIMFGYDNNEEEEKKVIISDEFGKKWVRTGDIGRVDKYGNVTVEGRIKRMIVRPDGHNVFPNAIEELLNTHYAVESVVVIGVKSEEYDNGSIPTAIIVLKEEYRDYQENIMTELIELSSKKLPPRDVALDYKFVDNIPLTSVGKIDIKSLEEKYNSEGKMRNAK